MMEDVHDHIRVIRHDPLAGGKAVHRHRLDAMLGFEPRVDFPGDRLQMRLRGARTDDEKIGEGGDAAEIEGDDVLGFFVGGVLCAKARELVGFNGMVPGKVDFGR